MLNPFPIQFLALLAYFILRLFVGGTLLYLGRTHLRHYEALKALPSISMIPFAHHRILFLILCECILGILIVLGAYTQYAVFATAMLALLVITFKKYFTHDTIPPRIFYTLLIGASITLFITGAGILAFDLPI